MCAEREWGGLVDCGGEELRGILFWNAPPSQAAILVLDKRMGSLAIISIALRGWGWRCMAVCSKRGPVAGVGLGRWLSDHSPGWFGAWG